MSERYEFIDAEYARVPAEGAGNAPTIVQMCRWLGVSKSGHHDWRSRPQNAAARRQELLKIKIKTLFEANEGTYGYRRMHAAPVRSGEQVGEELVGQLMRELGLVAQLAGDAERVGQLWENLRAIWSHAWSANYAVLEFMQGTGLSRFSPVKPQHWVVASFEHHTSPHGLPHPHVHNIVLTSLTTAAP